MKNICCLFLTLILFTELPATSLLPQDPSLPLALVAEKNNSKKYYWLGDAVSIGFSGDGISGKAKGLITRIGQDSVEVSSFNGKGISQVVAIHSILSISPVNRKFRKVSGIVMVIAGVIAATLAIASKGVFESAWGVALFGIPLIGIAVYLFLYIGFTYLDQLLEKRSQKGGWKFSATEAPAKRRGFLDLLFRGRK